jgi:methionine-rich copper-binding protein CopC
MAIGLFGKTMAALAVAAAASAPAFAATSLVSTTPEANATVTESPQQIDLRFSEGIVIGQSSFLVTGPRGPVRTTVGVDLNDKAHVFVSFWDRLSPGRYTVTWHVTSAAAARADGSYSFSVKPS